MRHTGLQNFTKINVNDQADLQKTVISDKLNIPIRKSVSDYEFGDLFIEIDSVNMVDSNSNINQLLDINNPDLIKSLLLSEIFFDEQINFDKTDAGSYNNKININDEYFSQYNINVTYDTTTEQDSTQIPSIIINIDTIENGDYLYNLLTEYSSYNIPIRTELKDNILNEYTYMIFYDSILQDTEKKELTVLLDNDNNSDILSDLTTIDIKEISLSNFLFTDTTSVNNYIEIPYHYHNLNELKDLNDNINNNNGFVKLVNGKIQYDFPQELNPDKFILKDSFFSKDQTKDLLNNKLFNLNITENSFRAEVNYTDSTIDLGSGSFIVEYEYNNTDINIDNNIKLETKNSQELNFSSLSEILMYSQYNNYYLAEIINFKYDTIINSEVTGVNEILSVDYQQIDKTSIDNNEMQIYDITDNTVFVITSYYDIQIIQPNINTIPFILITDNKLYKDDYGDIQLSIPESIDNITGNKHLTLRNDSDVYLISDSTILSFTIKYLDLLSGLQEEETIYPNETLNTKIKMDRGRIIIIPSDLYITYSIKIFNRQY